MSLPLLILWLHVLAAVVWVGGLAFQAHAILPAARRGQAALFAESARRGRPAAWTAIALVVLTGFYNVTQLGSLERVMRSGAALALAAKFGLVLVAVAIASQRDFVHLPRLLRDVATRNDPFPVLRTIATLDRLVLLLALLIIYLGLFISRHS